MYWMKLIQLKYVVSLKMNRVLKGKEPTSDSHIADQIVIFKGDDDPIQNMAIYMSGFLSIISGIWWY